MILHHSPDRNLSVATRTPICASRSREGVSNHVMQAETAMGKTWEPLQMITCTCQLFVAYGRTSANVKMTQMLRLEFKTPSQNHGRQVCMNNAGINKMMCPPGVGWRPYESKSTSDDNACRLRDTALNTHERQAKNE